MVSNIEQNISDTKGRIREIQQDLTRRAGELREDLWRRQQLASGKLRDESLLTAYGIKRAAFGQAAELLHKIPSLDQPAQQFRAIAEEAQAAEAALAKPPIADYDELNVKQVTDALEALDAWGLQKVRTYEEQNKGRVTVLRAVDAKLGSAA